MKTSTTLSLTRDEWEILIGLALNGKPQAVSEAKFQEAMEKARETLEAVRTVVIV